MTQHPHEYFLINWPPLLVKAPKGAKGVAKLEMSSGSVEPERLQPNECAAYFISQIFLRGSWTVLSFFEEY